jgi:hypothetical protein
MVSTVVRFLWFFFFYIFFIYVGNEIGYEIGYKEIVGNALRVITWLSKWEKLNADW